MSVLAPAMRELESRNGNGNGPSERPRVTGDEFRRVLGHFPAGVVVVTALDQGVPVGVTIQAFSSLSLDPPLVLLCPSRSSSSWPRIAAASQLVVNMLAEGQEDLARQFACSGADKYAGVEWWPAPITGAPVLRDAVAWLECGIEHAHPGGDHWIVVCEVHALSDRSDKEPLVFVRSGFRQLTPDDART